jgi:oxygen-dependent protoporphyrinogen oxidase
MVGIVGGGISGLALSHYLRQQRIQHVLLEGADVPGGVMRTETAGGVPLDLGPQRMRLTGAVRELVQSAGLEDELLYARPGLPLWVFRKGRLRKVPFTFGEALATDLIGWGGKLRLLMEPLTPAARPDESVADFFVRKFGREAYDAFLGPLYGGLYASDPARMKTRHGLQVTLKELGVEGSLLLAAARRARRAREEVPTVTFRSGLGALPAALARAAAQDGALRMQTCVDRIERTDGGWILRLSGSAAEASLVVDRVVLALPAHAAARLLEQGAPEPAAALRKLRYNPLAVVHLQSPCDLTGYGYQVAFGEALETRGVTWNASMFERDGVFTAYLGGMTNPAIVDWEDAKIAEVARREFRVATGFDSTPLLVSRTWIPAWDATWDALADLALPGRVDACTNWSARPGIPGRLAQAKALAARIAAQDSHP